uniref:Uncharacterized protein n=1 Tax=Chromera velia CCMP2878 TaxID=1169474 RepID=A0A0G4HWM2_9ALVE|eukprot:Cvel_9048.t1-p1 / transcript=Cvel_9048.t1 / gene=Cvel_9048 / organism=Chromera_velia_CCMP2878 / gene_product=hypothetical protein / transcript_product=hypothetical protein / location=Cvel_scaffold513:6750-7931(-) / protein_length=394 / sequence_SO=supercontig / SO=protein_coding / is_pseudo=false
MVRTRAEKRRLQKEQQAAEAAAAAAGVPTGSGEMIVLSKSDLQALIDSSVQRGIKEEMAALAPSLSQAPSPVDSRVDSPLEDEEQTPSVSASSSYCYVKVDFGAVPQMQNKQHIKEWEQKWQNFCNDQLPRERFVSDESWRNKMEVCFDKLENSEVNRDIQRLLDRGVLAQNIPRALRKEYGLLTFKVESKIALRIQFFPYSYHKVDKDGLSVVPFGLVFSYYTIHKRLDELLCDVSKEKYHIDKDGLVPNVLNSFTRVQHKEVLRALPDEVFEESGNVAELNDLSLSRIKFSILRILKILKKFALTDSSQTELQEQERERGSQGVERANRAAEGVNGGGQSSSGSQDSPPVCQTCGNRHMSTCRATLDGASPCRACGEKGHWDKAPVCKKNGG